MKTDKHQQALFSAHKLTLLFLFTAVFMTSCATFNKTPAKPDAQTGGQPGQQSPVFTTTLPLLLDYIAAQRGDWTYDKMAEIFSIGHFDDISSWKASWGNKDNSPYVEGALCKDLTVPDADKSLHIAGCYVYINKKYPLSLEQYSQLFGVEKSRIEKAVADDDRFIESRYKTLGIRATIEGGYVIAIVMSYEPNKS